MQEMTEQKIGFIGLGKMASAIIKGIKRGRLSVFHADKNKGNGNSRKP